jgi:TM2 domain-containing membrane protein YozV
MMRYDANEKSVGVAYVLWFFFGVIGPHRFYLKRTGTAFVMLIIFVVSAPLSFIGIGFIGLAIVGIWELVDAFLIPGLTRAYNNRLIARLNV